MGFVEPGDLLAVLVGFIEGTCQLLELSLAERKDLHLLLIGLLSEDLALLLRECAVARLHLVEDPVGQ